MTLKPPFLHCINELLPAMKLYCSQCELIQNIKGAFVKMWPKLWYDNGRHIICHSVSRANKKYGNICGFFNILNNFETGSSIF